MKKDRKKQKISYRKASLIFVATWFVLSSLIVRSPDIVHMLESTSSDQATIFVNIFWLLPIAPSIFYLIHSVDIWYYLRESHKESAKLLRYLTTCALFPLVMFFMYGWYIWQSFVF